MEYFKGTRVIDIVLAGFLGGLIPIVIIFILLNLNILSMPKSPTYFSDKPITDYQVNYDIASKFEVFPEDLNERYSFKADGEALAGMFGAKIRYGILGDDGLRTYCTKTSIADTNLAFFCPITPDTIWIADDIGNRYPDHYYEKKYLDTVKHELAHLLINKKCNTINPSVIIDRDLEGVTSSFAVLFLNADYNELQSTNEKYMMDDRTHELAQLIYSGQCKPSYPVEKLEFPLQKQLIVMIQYFYEGK